jgi:hypothetical protein
MAGLFAEVMPWLITRYLGEISYTQDRASRGDGRTWLSRASQLPRKAESNLCSALCSLGADRELKIILGGSSGGRMQLARAGLCWRPLA